jgi:hypothetical protein
VVLVDPPEISPDPSAHGSLLSPLSICKSGHSPHYGSPPSFAIVTWFGESAAASRAAEAQVLQRAIALAGVDDCLQVGRRLVTAGLAPDQRDKPTSLR